MYLPVEAIKRHEIELSTNQVKDHKQETVEVTCRGDPGSVFLAATMRESLFPQQGWMEDKCSLRVPRKIYSNNFLFDNIF